MKSHIVILVALLGLASHGLATVTYSVSLDTTPLVGHPAGPFSIAFALADGSASGDGNNALIINKFQFGEGGGPAGTPMVFGSAFGSLSSTVSLTDQGNVNFFAQRFTPGNTVTFSISVTTNADVGGILDEFTFYVLDNTLTPIPTMAGAPVDALMSGNLSPNLVAQTYASDLSRSPAAGGEPINIPAPQTVILSPSSVNFGSQTVGTTSAAETVRLTNAGSTVLSIATIGLSGADPSDFAQVNTCPMAPATLSPRATCTISVTFTPSASGSRVATLSVSEADGSTETVSLKGTGM